MITDKQRIDLIKHRLEQAEKNYKEIEQLMLFDNLHTAVNRIYYGMFYGLLALALKHHFETSKHQQLLGWFNKNFINAEIIEKKYGKIVQDAFERRMRSDYDAFVDFDKETVEQMYADMRLFLDRIRREIEKTA
jgi:uncharacterized protein (UPF0332 family)